MADQNVTIIKKKKVSGGGGHHGGAWKVAYADFVTAMMAFFLLMWLLNATTEKQRKGLADYFSPTIPIHKTSGGGNGPFGGETVFAEVALPQAGRGAAALSPTDEEQSKGDSGTATSDANDVDTNPSERLGTAETREDEEFELLEGLLTGSTGESETENELLQHVRTRLTDEGLVIELIDQDDRALFEKGSDRPTDEMVELLNVISVVVRTVKNKIALSGHSFQTTSSGAENLNWVLSSNRAHAVRRILLEKGLSAARVSRVTGQADQAPSFQPSSDIRNNRVELILLR